MAGGRPKIRIEKPDWFNPMNYDLSKSFTAEQWAEQLLLRSNILIRQHNWLIDTHEGWLKEGWEERIDWKKDDWAIYLQEQTKMNAYDFPLSWPKEECEREIEIVNSLREDYLDAKSVFQKLMDSPLTESMHSFEANFIDDMREFTINNESKSKGLAYSHLKSITIADAIPVANRIGNLFSAPEKEELKDYPRCRHSKHSDSIEEKSGLIYDEQKHMESTDLIGGNRPITAKKHIALSLAASDELLIEQFKQWLDAARENYGFTNERKITASNLRELGTNRVLAYIDLLIWSNFEGVKFRNLPSYYDLIFPEDRIEDKGQKIKSVMSLSTKALSSNYISVLLKQ